MRKSLKSGNVSVGRTARVTGSGNTAGGVTGSKRAVRPVREIDLHLRPGMQASEALERQLARFTGELKSAIRAGEKEVIFIHGAGSGRLREAIRGIIESEYPACICHDASFSRYGYNGATAVTIGK